VTISWSRSFALARPVPDMIDVKREDRGTPRHFHPQSTTLDNIPRHGGRLLIVDWCRAERTTALQRELVLDPLCRMWAIKELETARGYGRKLEAAGFSVVEIQDISDRVGPNWESGYQIALRAISEPLRPGHVVALATSAVRHGPEVVRAAKDQFMVTLLAKAAVDSGVLRYVLACASRR
jgi:hypothetical protein